MIEVHGSIELCICLECGGTVGSTRSRRCGPAARARRECTTCITPLKPDVVLFGEMLPEDALAERARRWPPKPT